MATVTLAESAKLSQNKLVAGVIENIITVNRMYSSLPFTDISGNALAYDREATLAPVATLGIGDEDGSIGSDVSDSATNASERQAAKDPATFTQITVSLTTIMGDAEMNGLIQATRSNINDQTAIQIGSKAKSAGRKYQDMMINGVSGTNYEFDGLLSLCADSQIVSAGTNGAALTFDAMDEVLDSIVDKDGDVDYMTAASRTIRAFYGLLRDLGGTSAVDVVQLPDGKTIPAYRSVPLFRNDYIPVDATQGTATTASYLFAGTFDDGSNSYGIAGLNAENQSGLFVEDVGVHQTKDEHVWRVKWYAAMALFSEKGLGMIEGLVD